jgi:ferredoxin
MKRREFCGLAAAMAGLLACGCGVGPSRGAFLQVNDRLCVGCGNCVKVCNGDAITVLDKKAFIDAGKCVQCAKCVKVCPYDAIE